MSESSFAPKPGPRRNLPLAYVYLPGIHREQAARSRCCQVADPAHEWHAYYPQNSTELNRLRSWYAKLPAVVQDILFGQLEDLFDSAAEGLTDPHGDDEPIKALRRANDSYELRALLEPDVPGTHNELFRHYHYEPPEPWENALVALHAHLKNTAGSRYENMKHQDAEIKLADKRCKEGRSNSWDLPSDTENLVEKLLGL